MVHTNVWGPSQVPPLSGSKFYITFIDDFSRYVWIYFLKHKSDVFGVAEKMNKTLNERTKSMSIHYELPNTLWTEK